MSMQYSIDNLIPETEGLSLLFEGTQSNIRQKIINQYASDSYSRKEGSGSSIIVSKTRTRFRLVIVLSQLGQLKSCLIFPISCSELVTNIKPSTFS